MAASLLRMTRDFLRPLVSADLEYRIRRTSYRLIPVATPTTAPLKIVHACVWKTASQWVRLVLSDPRLYRATGCVPYVSAHLRHNPASLKAFQAENRAVLLAAYEAPDKVLEMCGGATPKVFFVVRDPRAMLVSWYESTRFTHRPTDGVMAHRKAMEGMSDSDAFAYCTERFVEEFGPILDSWLDVRDTVCIIRFEDLTGKDSHQVWQDLFSFLGLTVSSDLQKAVLSTYSVESLAGRRSADTKSDKYAARGKRKWPEDVDAITISKAEELLERWRVDFGYKVKTE